MLIKNNLRGVFKKPIQTLLLVFLIIMSAFISVTLQGSTASIESFLEEYTDMTKQEDFFVILAVPTKEELLAMLESKGEDITDSRHRSKAQIMRKHHYFLIDYYSDVVTKISEEFNATLDGRFYRDIIEIKEDDEAHIFRLVKPTYQVNLTYVLEGQLPIDNYEIALFAEYANANGLALGDVITIQEEQYLISAFITIPDYIYPIFSFDRPIFNPQTETIAIVTDEVYDRFTENELVLYSGYFHEELEMTQVIQEIADFPGVSYTMGNEMNIRISTLDFHLRSNRLLASTFSNLLLLMCIVVVILILKKRINSDRMQIGILKAMGYSQMSILISYLIYPLFVAVMGSLIGFFLGVSAARSLANAYVVNFILPPVSFYFTPQLLVTGVIYPVLAIMLASFIVLCFLLKGGPIVLMGENSHLKLSAVSKGVMKLFTPFPFEIRFKYSLALRNLGKVLSLFFVVLVASIFLVFGFIAFIAVDQVADRAFSQANYRYEVKFSDMVNVEVGEDETEFLRFQGYPAFDVVSLPFYIYGIDPENKINPLYNAQGEDITSKSDEGLIINEFIARAYGLEIGDELILQIQGRTLIYHISEIVDHYNGAMMYISLGQLREDLGIGSSVFNGKWVNERPPLESGISYIFSMAELAQDVAVGLEMIRISLQMMVVVAIIIGSFMMIVITNFIIDENQKQISILKVMGYSEQEISNLVLTIYFPFVVFAYLLGVGLTLVGIDLIMGKIANQLPMVIPTDFTLWQTIQGAGVVMVTYFIAVKCSKIQLNKVSLQEVLKY